MCYVFFRELTSSSSSSGPSKQAADATLPVSFPETRAAGERADDAQSGPTGKRTLGMDVDSVVSYYNNVHLKQVNPTVTVDANCASRNHYKVVYEVFEKKIYGAVSHCLHIPHKTA